MGVKILVKHGVGFPDLFPVCLGDVGQAGRTGVFIDVFGICQHIESGNPVTGSRAHAQAVFQYGASGVGPADEAAVSFLGGGDDLDLGEAVLDHPASVPAGNASYPGAQGGMVVAALDLAGDVAVVDERPGVGFAYDTAHCHQPLHGDVHRGAVLDGGVFQVSGKGPQLVHIVLDDAVYQKYLLDHRPVLDHVGQDTAAGGGDVGVFNHQVLNGGPAYRLEQGGGEVEDAVAVSVEGSGKGPRHGGGVRGKAGGVQILGEDVVSIRRRAHLGKELPGAFHQRMFPLFIPVGKGKDIFLLPVAFLVVKQDLILL